MSEPNPRNPRWKTFGTAAVAVVAVGLVAVLVVRPGQSNVDPACRDAVAAAEALTPFARGEVAAFQPTTAPIALADLEFTGPEGNPVQLADFSGDTVLLNLWATWCAPCRAEMPALDRLEAAEGGEDFHVVALNVDQRADPRPFLTEVGIENLALYTNPTITAWRQLQGKGIAPVGLPTTILIDGNGCHLGVMSGPAEWDTADAKALIDAVRAGAA